MFNRLFRFSRLFTPMLALAIVTVIAAGPAMAQGSASDIRAQYVADIETMASKFKELAGAMDTGTYGWQPMDGVRTVSEVFMLIVAENYVVPAAWGATPPDGMTVSPAMFKELTAVTDKSEVLGYLEKSSAHMLDAVASISDQKTNDTIQMFGPGAHGAGSLVLDRRRHARAPGSGHRVRAHERGRSTLDGAPATLTTRLAASPPES